MIQDIKKTKGSIQKPLLLLLFRRDPPLFYSRHPVKPVKVAIIDKSLLFFISLYKVSHWVKIVVEYQSLLTCV